MRVLLPLKKKLNDANELHDEDDEFDDESLLQLVEVDGEVFHAASPESDGAAQVLAEAWTQVLPEAAYLASATSNNEGPTSSALPSCQGSVVLVGDSQSAKADLVTAGITTQYQQLTDDNERVSKKDSRTTNNTCIVTSSDETGNTTTDPAQSTRSTAAANASLRCNSAFASNNQSANPESAAKSTGAEHTDPLISTATLPVFSVSTVPSASTTTVAPLTTHSRLRKRRSNSPPGSPADSKPPSKKGRDTKPPARESAASAPFGSNSSRASSFNNNNNNNNNMAGGGNSRGGRKLWTSGSPYYVESNAGTGGTGREDISNNSDDSAELDVRFAYRHENDPASARGDAPNPSVRVPRVASTNHLGNGVGVPKRRAGNKRANTAGFYAACGRDDDDEIEREITVDRPESDEDHFALMLKKQGLEIVEQEGDGNCLFRAISLQVYGDASMHGEVRHRCLDFMARDKEHFSQFITDEPFEQYIQRKRQDGVHGNNPEIQAISELFNRPIEVFVPENGATPLNIFHAEYKTQDAPIRLSYHDGNHYNAVIDPLVPTAGLGLGLPGLQPGLADKLQMAKAVAESDRMADQREFERALEESQNDQLQRAIKESTLTVDHMFQNKALSLSDCDATNFELEQAVLESSLETFRMYEHGRKQASSTTTRSASVANGRRKHDNNPGSAAAGKLNSSVASMPEARQDSEPAVVPHAASVTVASVASASAPAVASKPSSTDGSTLGETGSSPLMAEHYPQTVQELVMNGFDLPKVVRAYELVGDNFDDLLAFLMSNSS